MSDSDFERSLSVAQEAMENLSIAALRYLCETAKRQYPTAVTIIVDESDQGEWMSYSTLLDVDGNEVDDADDFDDQGTSANLYQEGWGAAWQEYADRGAGSRNSGWSWSIDIDSVLNRPAPTVTVATLEVE